MNTLQVGTEFYSALKENNFSVVKEGVQEIREKLFLSWNDSQNGAVEDLLALSFQRLKRAKRDNPDWKVSIAYQVGMLEGVVSAYEELYREKKEREAIDQYVKQTLHNSGPVTKKVFAKLVSLDAEEWIGHKELALDVGTSESSLSNIMKRLVISRAVETERIGKRTNYRVTSAGKRFYAEKLAKQRPEEMLDTILEGMTILNQKIENLTVHRTNRLSQEEVLVNVDMLKYFLKTKAKFENRLSQEQAEDNENVRTEDQFTYPLDFFNFNQSLSYNY